MSNFWNRVCAPMILRREGLKNAFLDIRVVVRIGETVLGETDFSVALTEPGIARQETTGEAGVSFAIDCKETGKP
jgi:hypothetical protein